MTMKFAGSVVCGFGVSIEEIFTTVTKYYEDTGESYEEEMYSHNDVLVGDVVVGSLRNCSDGIFDGESVGDFEIFKIGPFVNGHVLGISLGYVNSRNIPVTKFNPAIPEPVKAVSKAYNFTPKFYLFIEAY